MISCALSRIVIVCFGTLYPAYASYKAVKTKNVKEYVKWMMYWIVFALFNCAETFTDVFLAFWFPFYYEIKVILVLWLLSPVTKGSSFLYRKFVHPQLAKREKDIDEFLARAKEQGYHTVLQLGTKGLNYASQVLVQTALKGGGHIANQIHRSYSLTDLHRNPPMPNPIEDEADTAAEEDSFPLDDISERQFSLGRIESESENSLARGDTPQVKRSRGSSLKSDDPSSGYASSEVTDDTQCSRTSGRVKLRRTRSTAAPRSEPNAYEVGSSATLPRTSRRISTRRKNTLPID